MASIGPKLPPGFVVDREESEEDENESDQKKSESEDSSSDSDDEMIGPLPPPAEGPSLAVSAAEAIERRQLAMKKKLEDAEVNKISCMMSLILISSFTRFINHW